MVSEVTRRYCANPWCGKDISHRGARATTCDDNCRQQKCYWVRELLRGCTACGAPFSTEDLGGPLRDRLCLGDYRAQHLAAWLRKERPPLHQLDSGAEILRKIIDAPREDRRTIVDEIDLTSLSDAELDLVGLALVDTSPLSARRNFPVIEELAAEEIVELCEDADAEPITVISRDASQEVIRDAGEVAAELADSVLIDGALVDRQVLTSCFGHLIATGKAWPKDLRL